MTARKPLLMDVCEFLDKKPEDNLPPHDFHIGENYTSHTGQLPNFRAMASHVVGKAPLLTPVIHADPIGLGVYSLGALIGDAYLKLLRPWPLEAGEGYGVCGPFPEIGDVISLMSPLSPKAAGTREAFLSRVGEFVNIALHDPRRLPTINANIDALTNARLTERARETLLTGIDPGASDLWGEGRLGEATTPAQGARHE